MEAGQKDAALLDWLHVLNILTPDVLQVFWGSLPKSAQDNFRLASRATRDLARTLTTKACIKVWHVCNQRHQKHVRRFMERHTGLHAVSMEVEGRFTGTRLEASNEAHLLELLSPNYPCWQSVTSVALKLQPADGLPGDILVSDDDVNDDDTLDDPVPLPPAAFTLLGAHAPRLTSLHLDGALLSLGQLAKLSGLRQLELRGCTWEGVDPGNVQSALPSLTSLSVKEVLNFELDSLQHLTTLQELRVANQTFTSSGQLTELSGLTRLSLLSFDGTVQFDLLAQAELMNCSGLRNLVGLSDLQVTVGLRCIEVLPRLTNLTRLCFSSFAKDAFPICEPDPGSDLGSDDDEGWGGDEGCPGKVQMELPALVELELRQCRLVDAASLLEGAPNLARCSGAGAELILPMSASMQTGRELHRAAQVLTALPHPPVLHLDLMCSANWCGAPNSAASGSQAPFLSALQGLPLRALTLSFATVTAELVDALCEAAPGLSWLRLLHCQIPDMMCLTRLGEAQLETLVLPAWSKDVNSLLALQRQMPRCIVRVC